MKHNKDCNQITLWTHKTCPTFHPHGWIMNVYFHYFRGKCYKIATIGSMVLKLNDMCIYQSCEIGESLFSMRKGFHYLSLLSMEKRSFKCLHNCSPSYITDMFLISAKPYDTRGGTKLMQPKVNTTRNGLKSFRYQGAKIWNELPTSIKNTEDVSEFKYRLNEWPGPVCKCSSCDVCKFKNI